MYSFHTGIHCSLGDIHAKCKRTRELCQKIGCIYTHHWGAVGGGYLSYLAVHSTT